MKLHLTDVYGNYLTEPVDIILENTSLTDKHRFTCKPGGIIEILGLLDAPHDTYKIYADPPSYLPINNFIRNDGVETGYEFIIDPRKVTKIDYSNVHVPFLYDHYSDLQKCGLLNIYAKAEHTLLASGRTVQSYLGKINKVRPDRVWFHYAPGLLEEVDGDKTTFREVSDVLHAYDDEVAEVSFKTEDHYGNLQLTFYILDDGTKLVELDIDDANGLMHLFQVSRNHLVGRRTHPFDIQQILISYQGIDPGYRLIV